jgi:hypothetical protein
MLQALIEHVANHDPSALRPLSHAAVLMIELRLAPFPCASAPSNVSAHVKADPMARCDIGLIRRPSGVRFGIVGRSGELWAKESRFTGKRSVEETSSGLLGASLEIDGRSARLSLTPEQTEV